MHCTMRTATRTRQDKVKKYRVQVETNALLGGEPHSTFIIPSPPPHALKISLSSSPRNTLQTHRASSRHSSASVSLPLPRRSKSSTRAPNPRQTTTARATTAPTRTARRRQLGRVAVTRTMTPRKMPRWARAVCAWCASRWRGVRGGPAYRRTRDESARG